MKWKWVVSFFFCLFLICMAYCLEYQKTMYEIEKKQIEILSEENRKSSRRFQHINDKWRTEKKRLDVYTKVV